MKRPLQLSLAIALALGATNAFALGLGPIQVQSGLNQPLKAEILIIQSAPGEAEGLIVQLATDEDFERVGMNRSGIGVPLEFTQAKNAKGEPIIRITSKEIVREPFVGLLLEANWPKGRLLREYTVLLDPPIMAPAVKGASAVAVATKEPEPTAAKPLPPSQPAAKAPPAPAVAATPPAAKPKPAPPEPAAVAPTAPRVSGGDQYGPVAAGETLGEIARATLPNDSVNINQMMLALLKSNPQAFFKDNINALKRGAVLRIPNAEEVAANGSAREAAAAVRAQIDEWRGVASSAPTLVADTAPASTSTSASPTVSAKTSGERLALVPPREGTEGQQSADRPSGGRAGGTGDAATKAELARVKEALTSEEQESTELKSRVKDLEDIRGKNEKLISLQSTELAELREKLKALQEQESAQAAAAAKAPPVVAAPAVVEPAPAAANATPTSPASAKSDTTPTDSKITKDDIWGDADSVVATPPGASETPKDATASTASSDLIDSSATPTADAPSAPPATTASATPEKAPPAAAKAAQSKPAVAKPAAPVKPRPVAAEPWYLQPWALAAAGIGGLLLVILGIFGLRKRKPAARVTRTSIASSFGDSPVGMPGAANASDDLEEQELIEQVKADPTNAGAHLELLSLYYAQGASEKFEAAAEEMYAYIADPNQPAWREVRTMGEELVPHNPLFSQQDALASGYSADDHADEYRFDETAADEPMDFPDFVEPADPEPARSSLATASMPAFEVSDFDLGETRMPPATASADTSFSFDLPPIDEAPSMKNPSAGIAGDKPESVAMPAEVADDEFFAGEDAIGTKLDLAKAYLDMGDPEGARAMLEEVLAEGAPAQQDEARKLISEIG